MLRSKGIATHVKPSNTIRQALVSPKDKDDTMDQAGVVYHIQCGNCPAEYVGESARTGHMRGEDHVRDLLGGKEGKPLWMHSKEMHEGKLKREDYKMKLVKILFHSFIY